MRLPVSLVVVLFAVALGIRLDGIAGPPLDASKYASQAIVIRQYHSALLARAYYLDWRSGSSQADRKLAAGIEDDETLVEPPLIELATGGLYVAMGGEHLWVPRLLVALAWLVGGLFLLRIAERITSRAGALVAVALYLFLPFAIVASRAFQPDPVMVAALLGTALAILRYGEAPTSRRFAVAVAAAAAAALIKPGWALFFLVPLFVGVATRGLPARRRLGRVAAFSALAVVPTALYVAYGEVFRHFLRGQAADKVQPGLLLHPQTWKGWLAMIGDVLDPRPSLGPHSPALGLVLVVVALACAAVAVRSRRDVARVLVPLWVGYAAFGVVFATHMQNHNYYSLVLVPLAALSVGAVVPRLPALRVPRVAVAAAVVVAAAVWVVALHGDLASADYGRAAATYERIGAQIGHRSAIVLGPDFAEPLEYHGRLRTRWWPTPGDLPASEQDVTVAQRLAPANSRYWPALGAMDPQPAYFLAAADEIASQDELRRYLQHLPLVATRGGYAIRELHPNTTS